MNQYLQFTLDEPAMTGRKTQVWIVRATRDYSRLGTIRWFGCWRQYVFFPEPETAFNPDCLDSITAWIRRLMAQRRAAASPGTKEDTDE